MKVTLTFDNGPDPGVTPRVLDILARERITAHFYVLGKFLGEPARRACVERARDEGHVIGNHSFTHETPLGDDVRPDAVEKEIVETERVLDAIVPGQRLFRPFGGGGKLGPHLFSSRAVEYLRANRYSCVLWNSVPRDWVDRENWPEHALSDCAALDHAVVVLHDVPNACLTRLEHFIGRARAAGASFVAELPPSCLPMVDGEIVASLDVLSTKR